MKARCQHSRWHCAASDRLVLRVRGALAVLCRATARHSLWVILATVLAISDANAQDAEPRLYTNAPVGLNFLILGHLYSEGKIAFDPSSSITDAEFHSNTEALAYVRTLDIGGKSAKFDVILPYSSFSASGLVAGRPREREMSGLGDPRFRLSINFLGAPALSAQEFASYQQDLIVGASLQVSAPLGQYDDTKLLNLGNNRWSFRPELGISKAWGPWTVEVVPSVTLFTDNPDFFGARTLSQAPIYAVRGDIVYHFKSGIWVSLDGTYFTGGRTTVDGVRGDNEQSNTRAGLTLALPLDRQNSVKFNASTGSRHAPEATSVSLVSPGSFAGDGAFIAMTERTEKCGRISQPEED